jgi:hypothetical protein
MNIYTVPEFIDILKTNNIEKIKKAMSSIIKTKKTILSLEDRLDVISDNVCSLNIKSISELIDHYRIKYYNGGEASLYENAVDCPVHVFGFINAYYSVDNETRFDAYKLAVKHGRIDILKKIRVISTKNLEKIRRYVTGNPAIKPEVIEYIKSEHRKSRSKKDTSPEDFLNSKIKRRIKM